MAEVISVKKKTDLTCTMDCTWDLRVSRLVRKDCRTGMLDCMMVMLESRMGRLENNLEKLENNNLDY